MHISGRAVMSLALIRSAASAIARRGSGGYPARKEQARGACCACVWRGGGIACRPYVT